jgi:amino acid adenylation domain-containing protein
MPIDQVQTFAASAIQQQFWLLQQLTPDKNAYNIPLLFVVDGKVDEEAFRKSIDKIVSRHEIFRTVFGSEHGIIFQKIKPDLAISFRRHDFSTEGFSQDNKTVRDLIQGEVDRPFDLTNGPLLRCLLVRLADNKSLLLFVMHHIITDLHTYKLFAKVLSNSYHSFSIGNPAYVTAPACSQYREYAEWQQQWMDSDEYRQMIVSWKGSLTKRDGYLNLPFDDLRPSDELFSGGASTLKLNRDLVKKLNDLAKQQNVNLFLLLLASYYVLLHRYSNQSEIIVGVPFTNRRKENHKDIMGCFVNNLPVTIDIHPEMFFEELLQLLRKEMLTVHRQQEVPFKEIVSSVQCKRNSTYNPLFQVGFTFQPPIQLELPGVVTKPVPLRSSDVQLDLFPVLWETDGEVVGFVNYNAKLFHKKTIDRFVEHWRILLTGLVDGKDLPVRRLPILGREEKVTLLERWNSTATEYPRNCCLHGLFENQVKKTPNAPALFFDDLKLTYEELNDRANQLGHYLQKQGVGPEVLVGVFMERSMEMVVALYGILKAGGAYVPLDPGFPDDRLTFMMEDADLRVVLTQQHFLGSLPANDCKIFCLDSDWHLIELEKCSPVVSTVKGDNLAYVIYTSGSTGRPKGAMNQHDAICNRLFWMQDEFQLHHDDRVLQKTPYSFDVSVWEFFWPLQVGAGLVMAPPNSHYDPIALTGLIEKFGITTIHFVPSMLRVFLETPRLNRCRSLKYLICSGETLSHDLQKKVFTQLPAEQTKLYNLYGPTEAAVDVTYWHCRRGYDRKIVPIGNPIANTKLYIVDRFLQPTPIGVPGELLIGGVQVARGYLNRPELSNTSFIDDVFSDNSAARLYKTGDLARYLPDGTIEYLGRLDHQIKLNGLRIELGEIEALTSQHDCVRQAVAIMAEMKTGEKALAVYAVVEDSWKRCSTEFSKEIKNFLAQKLPSYMVPSLVITVTELPLTVSGKVDRKALRVPTGLPDITKSEPAIASNLEMQLFKVWQKILKNDNIGVTDNFFDVGGDSLLAIMVISEINKAYQSEIPVVKFFQYPTVQSFAKFMTAELEAPAPEFLQNHRSLRQRTALARQRKN